VARRHALAALLVAVAVAVAVAGATARGGSSTPRVSTPVPPFGARHDAVRTGGSDGREAVVVERPERATEASASDRRTSSRDARVLELLAVLGMGLAALTGLSSAMARRRSGRAPTRSRRLAPARAPPLLLPS
jgi:hypothetical protein